MPSRANSTDAGLDLFSAADFVVKPGESVFVNTGFSVAIPPGFMGMVCSRSGQGIIRVTLPNSIGIIDSDYRGYIKVILVNEGTEDYNIYRAETKVAQLIILPIVLPTLIESKVPKAEWLESTNRGAGGFGSTGR